MKELNVWLLLFFHMKYTKVSIHLISSLSLQLPIGKSYVKSDTFEINITEDIRVGKVIVYKTKGCP